MGIDEILKCVPRELSKLISKVYIISKKVDECFVVEYNDETVKTKEPFKYEYINGILSNELLNKIEESENVVEILANKIILATTKNIYKYVFEIEKINDVKKFVLEEQPIAEVPVEQNIEETPVEQVVEEAPVEEEKKTLLIADDSDVITKFFCRLFDKDFNVIVAKNGKEAIDVMNSNDNIDGVFIDLQMPVMSGFEVLDYMNNNGLFAKFPVSVISGEDSQEGIQRVSSYNIVDMLQKPFSAEAANSIVDKTISKK